MPRPVFFDDCDRWAGPPANFNAGALVVLRHLPGPAFLKRNSTMTSFFASAAPKAVAILRQIAPDFTQTLYVTAAELVAADAPLTAGGLASMNLDVVVRPFVEWQGPGAAFLISAQEVALAADPWRAFISLSLHEFAHVIDYRSTWPATEAEPADVDAERELVQSVLTAERRASEFQQLVDLYHHGPGFIRAMAILVERFNETTRGDLTHREVFGYELPPGAPLIEILAANFIDDDEIRRPLMATCAAPIPDLAQRQWQRVLDFATGKLQPPEVVAERLLAAASARAHQPCPSKIFFDFRDND